MKKIIALFLLLSIALSLAACGGAPKEVDPATAIIGKWKNDAGDVMEFTANHGGTCVNGPMASTCTWQYVEADNKFLVDYTSAHDYATVTQSDNGTLILTWKGVEFKRIG